MRENEVEKQFVEAVRAAGGQALKFTSQSMNGVPDRLVLLLGGKCAFVELKAPGKQMRILQRKRRLQLEALGFPVFCVDRPEQIQPAIHALICWKPGEPIPQGIGVKIPELVIGGTVKPAEGEEAVKLSQRAYAKPDDIEAYKKLKAAGTKLYAQYVPADAEVSIDEFLK